MENIQMVVKERDEAYNLLETGKTGEPGRRRYRNFLGLWQWKNVTEHMVPPHLNKFHYLQFPRYMSPRTVKFLKLYREKRIMEKGKERLRERRRVRTLVKEFPHLEGKLNVEGESK